MTATAVQLSGAVKVIVPSTVNSAVLSVCVRFVHAEPFQYSTAIADIPTLAVTMSILMVSNVPYNSFKKMKLSRPKSLQLLIFVVLCFLLIMAYPQNTIFIIFLLYLLTGIAEYIWRYFRLRGSAGAPRINGGNDKDSGTHSV